MGKTGVSALFQPAQHVRNMFSYKSVNDTYNARPKDSMKKCEFPKKKKKKKKKKTTTKKQNDFLP